MTDVKQTWVVVAGSLVIDGKHYKVGDRISGDFHPRQVRSWQRAGMIEFYTPPKKKKGGK